MPEWQPGDPIVVLFTCAECCHEVVVPFPEGTPPTTCEECGGGPMEWA